MDVTLPFRNRAEAGRCLAARLGAYGRRKDVLVLALPRGGLPVAFEVAIALRAPLDVFVVRKLGVPYHEELAMGAIASGGVRVLNTEILYQLHLSSAAVERAAAQEERELERRERLYRGSLPALEVAAKAVILVDDGLATGATMRAAVKAVGQMDPAEVVVAVPVGAPDTCDTLRAEADRVVCVAEPEPFYAVGVWYRDFRQTTDEEVRDILSRAAQLYALPEPYPSGV